MIHRGVQYSRAIRTYYKKFGRYPTKIEDLESANNLRFLRKRYKDPENCKNGKCADFVLLHFGDVQLALAGGLQHRAGGCPFRAAAIQSAPKQRQRIRKFRQYHRIELQFPVRPEPATAGQYARNRSRADGIAKSSGRERGKSCRNSRRREHWQPQWPGRLAGQIGGRNFRGRAHRGSGPRQQERYEHPRVQSQEKI